LIKPTDSIGAGLKGNGREVIIAHTGEAGLKHLRDNVVDHVLLDITLPRVGGLEILREIRRSRLKSPVLILTSKESVDDRVRRLDSGADIT
jgi:DNA-binding response OmpR family regulator